MSPYRHFEITMSVTLSDSARGHSKLAGPESKVVSYE